MTKEEIVNLVEDNAISDAFEALFELNLLKGDLLQLEEEYTKATSSRDVNYKDRLKAAIRRTFRGKLNKTESIDETIESMPDISVGIDHQVKTTQNLIPKSESYFVGRQKELLNLEKIFNEDSFIAIVGTGGMGKTQLITRYLEKHPIPQEQLCWVQCEPTTSLDSIMEQLGYSELLKTKDQKDLVKIENFIYRLEREERVLFLEDYHDINEKELIEKCLNHSQGKIQESKIVLISRDKVRSLKLSPRQLDLKGFETEEDLLALIDQLSMFFNFGDAIVFDQGELLSLAKRLEGHPLAIYLAFHLLESGASIKDIEQEIIHLGNEEMGFNKKETISERLLNAIFTRSDASEEEQQFIKEFSVFRGMVKGQIISVILRKDYHQIANKLKRKNILKLNRRDDDLYYYLHPLVREFCYERLNTDVLGIARSITLHLKVAQYFIKKRSAILSIIEEERIHYHLIRANAWDQIARDIEELGEAMIAQGHLDHLEKLMNHLKGVYAQVPQVALALRGTILYKKGRIDEAAKLFLQAESESHFKTRIKGILGYGELLYRQGEIENAYVKFKLVLEFLKDKTNLFIREQIFALLSVGVYFANKGNYNEGISLYKEAEELAQKNNLESELATALFNIGRVYKDKGEYNKALNLYSESLYISRRLGNQFAIASSLNSIGRIHKDKGEYAEALKLHGESLDISRQLGNQSGIATSLNNIGRIHKEKREYGKALKLHRQSLDISKQLGNQSGIATSLNSIGGIHEKKEEYGKALKLHRQSLDISRQLGNQSGIAVSLNEIANIYYSKREYDKALKLYKESLHIEKKLGRQSAIATSLNNIGSTKKKQKKIPEAISDLLQSLLIKKLLKTPYKYPLSWLLNIKKEIGLNTYKKLIEKSLVQYDESLQAVFTGELIDEVLGTPIRKEAIIRRNTKVEVQYSDDSIKILKYKKVETAHKNGEVKILRVISKD